MIAVVGQQRPSPLGGKQQLSGIRRAFASLRIGRRNTVSATNKEMCQSQGNVLVEIERCHLRGAVCGETRVNRLFMLAIVCDRRIHGLT